MHVFADLQIQIVLVAHWFIMLSGCGWIYFFTTARRSWGTSPNIRKYLFLSVLKVILNLRKPEWGNQSLFLFILFIY